MLIAGLLVFLYYNNFTVYSEGPEIERFRGDTISSDSIVLLEERDDAWVSRINLIENAKESLDIAYYTIHKGVISETFFATIVEAADRGVQVRILFDGIFHNLRGSSRSIQYVLTNHPNIELKFYEPLNLLKPWTFHNRLHDKYIIVDNDLVMMGGRNIGDNYLLGDYSGEMIYDRDIVIVNTDRNNFSGSVINDIKDYYEMLWEHRFSRYSINKLISYQIKRGKKKEKYLKDHIDELKSNNNEIFNQIIDWQDRAIPTNKITLLYNPITRFNKEPWILREINSLMLDAEESIFIQSPYIIPTKQMFRYISLEQIQSKKITILTNSIASSPNYLGIAGYANKKKQIMDYSTHLYEYQSSGSIHAKSLIIDNLTSIVGTFNFDARSSFLNTESMVVIDSEKFNQKLKASSNDIIKKSLLVGEDLSYKKSSLTEERKVPIIKGLIIGLLRVITFFIDFLL